MSTFTCTQQEGSGISFFNWIMNPFTSIVNNGSSEYVIRSTTANTKFMTSEMSGRGFAPYILAMTSTTGFCVTCRVRLSDFSPSDSNPRVVSGIAALDSSFNRVFEVGFGTDAPNSSSSYETIPERRVRTPAPGAASIAHIGLKYNPASSVFTFHNGETNFEKAVTTSLPVRYVVLFMRGEGVFTSTITDITYNGLSSVTALPTFYTGGTQSEDRYTMVANVTSDAETLDQEGTAELADCRALCDSVPACTGFEFKNATKSCTLKKIVFPQSSPTYSSSTDIIQSLPSSSVTRSFDISSTGQFIAVLYRPSVTSTNILEIFDTTANNMKAFEYTGFLNPIDFKFDSKNNIYVSDYNQSIIIRLKITPSMLEYYEFPATKPSFFSFFRDEDTLAVVQDNTEIALYRRETLVTSIPGNGIRISSIVATQNSIIVLRENILTIFTFNSSGTSVTTTTNITITNDRSLFGNLQFNNSTKLLSILYYSQVFMYREQSDGSFVEERETKTRKITGTVTSTQSTINLSGNVPANQSNLKGMVVTASKIYVCDRSNHVIKEIDIATKTDRIIAGTFGTSGASDGTGSNARFQFPFGLAINGAGTELYITEDRSTASIRKLIISTGVVSTINFNSGGPIVGNGSIIISGTKFYISSPFDNRVYSLTSTSRNLSVVVSSISSPRSLVSSIDRTRVYVASVLDFTIKEIIDSTVTVIAGAVNQSGGTDGTGSTARFSSPTSITITPDGKRLYILDGNSIRELEISTKIVRTVLIDSSLNSPRTIAINPSGTSLYIATSSNIIKEVPIQLQLIYEQLPPTRINFIQNPVDVAFDKFGMYFAVANSNSIKVFKNQGNGKFVDTSYDTVNLSLNSYPRQILFDKFSRSLFVMTHNSIKKFPRQILEEPTKFSSPNPSNNSETYIKFDTSIFDRINLRLDFGDKVLKDISKRYSFNIKTLILESSSFLVLSDKNVIISRNYYYHIMTYPADSGTSRIAFRFPLDTDISFYIITKNLTFGNDDDMIILNDEFDNVMNLDSNQGVQITKTINPGPIINVTNNLDTTKWNKSKIMQKVSGTSYQKEHVMFKGNIIEYYENNTKIRDRQVTITHDNFKITVKDSSTSVLLATFFAISSDLIVLMYYNTSDNIFNMSGNNPVSFYKNTDVELIYLVERSENLSVFLSYLTFDDVVLRALKSLVNYSPISPISEEFIIYRKRFISGTGYSLFFKSEKELDYRRSNGSVQTFNYYNYQGYIIYFDIYGTVNILCTDSTQDYTTLYRYFLPTYNAIEDRKMQRLTFTINPMTPQVKSTNYIIPGGTHKLRVSLSTSEIIETKLTGISWATYYYQVYLNSIQGDSIILDSDKGIAFTYNVLQNTITFNGTTFT